MPSTNQSWPKLTCWLSEKMGRTKFAGYTGWTSVVLTKRHHVLYCCDPCLEVAHEIISFMRQTKGGLKGVINSFGIATSSFRRADEFLSVLDSQFNSLKLLDESPRRKKAMMIRASSRSSGQPQQILKCC